MLPYCPATFKTRLATGYPLLRLLRARLDKPERFVERLRVSGEDIGRGYVAACLPPQRSPRARSPPPAHSGRWRCEMVLRFVDVRWVWLQRRLFGDDLGGAERRIAELDRPLGHGVDMNIEIGPKAVEHFVHGDELRALYAPVSLLGDQRQNDPISQARIEELDIVLTDLFPVDKGIRLLGVTLSSLEDLDRVLRAGQLALF